MRGAPQRQDRIQVRLSRKVKTKKAFLLRFGGEGGRQHRGARWQTDAWGILESSRRASEGALSLLEESAVEEGDLGLDETASPSSRIPYRLERILGTRDREARSRSQTEKFR